ncbi:MAG: nickel pincer cofactor biosynthesis protein LarB [Ignavibacteria bacterium]|nr:nickel pincer cofactor biosynthesis protein LarB [Ignavibacteria bacterium]
MPDQKTKRILEKLIEKKLSIDEAEKSLNETRSSISTSFANIDIEREHRTFIPEIIYCENKSLEQIIELAKKIYSKKKLVIGTRCHIKHFKELKKIFPKGVYSNEGRSFRIGKPFPKIKKYKIGLITAGTTDIAACEEAGLVLKSLGADIERIYDVGVAGIHRLFSKDNKIKECDILIVAAGMEGALPSVVSGLYHQPLIAIPTSIGYGTAMNGFTALFAMLTSCSPGVTVVNINNGVGAAAAAFKILKLLETKSS